ncbi:Protein kinase-like domain protein [Cordyceps fumosorosea ARSEF 2679]|uniref:EKC/KEOPS complex subunit BUD32 n=1 Tax=Cordyceps fumosorosea (strain ARSEF 2679) TaxID=1081104 RepID=A0A167T0F5_CORFA|nr:Protein kinase-like domain protein [Cordyceps fumosorosea ARSEF 2679]OAA60119.1 Protein kinase-like domain protein [Cordyceps fumosorosea ARSEF 2679]
MDSEWEFYSMRERWGDIAGVRMFLYTHVLYLRNKTELWTARVAGRYASPVALPARDAFRVRVADYDGTPTLGQYLLHEARIAQRLPHHPNLARFRGCLLDGGQITGLCFDRCAETLTERMRRRGPVDVASTMAQLGAAVAHLHAQDIVHNDVCEDNVMFADRDGGHVVLVDFDSCAARGGGLPRKRGPTAPGATSSEFENDHVGLQLVHRKLLRYERDMRRNLWA